MATKQHRTASELVRIYQLTKEGKSQQQVSSELGIAPKQVGSSWSLLTKYLRGKSRDQSHQSHAYTEAVKQIRSRQRSEKRAGGQIAGSPASNGYTFLEKSFQKFQASLATFVEVEVNTRTKSTIDENTRLKEEVETLKKQVADLTEQLETTSKSDLISSIKSKLPDIDSEQDEQYQQINLDL
jgi:hypothetical protein